MADPVSLTAIAVGATALAGATKAIGEVLGGKASSQMYKYQAGVALMNQQVQKQNADYARQVGEAQAQASGIKTAQQVGEIKTIQSGSNIDINTGSGAQVRADQKDVGLHEQAIIRSNAAKKAFGYEVEAAEKGAQATLYGMSAKKSTTAGYINATGTILSTVGSVAGKWLSAGQAGVGADASGPNSGGGDSGGFDV